MLKKRKKKLEDLDINELKKIEPRLTTEVMKVFNLKNSVKSNQQNQTGGIINKEKPIHISNVRVVENG